MSSDAKDIAGVAFTILMSVCLCVSGIMITDRFTRKARTADEEVKIQEAKTKQYIEKFTSCQNNNGIWENGYCVGRK